MPGTTEYTREQETLYSEKITFTVIADSGDGSILSKETDDEIHGYVTRVVTDPTGTNPTTLYDLTLKDADGCDVMGGALADRSASVVEQAMPLFADVPAPARVDGKLTLAGLNNSVVSATISVHVYVAIPRPS